MNCPFCGKEINENETFCKACGSPLSAKARAFSTMPQTKKTKMLKVSDYLLMFLFSIISPVNYIMWFIWLFNPNTNVNKKNYAAAALIFNTCLVVLIAIGYALSMYITRI